MVVPGRARCRARGTCDSDHKAVSVWMRDSARVCERRVPGEGTCEIGYRGRPEADGYPTRMNVGAARMAVASGIAARRQ